MFRSLSPIAALVWGGCATEPSPHPSAGALTGHHPEVLRLGDTADGLVAPVGLPTTEADIQAPSFAPGEGRAGDAGSNSPGERRLLLAESDDGQIFLRTDEILIDQANAPSAIRLGHEILVYSTAHGVTGSHDGTVVSARRDGDPEWRHYVPVVLGLPDTVLNVVESCAALGPDGRVHLYFGAVTDDSWTIHSATSDDGLVFAYEGEALPSNDSLGHDGGYVDPLVVWFEEAWHMYVTESSTSRAVHGLSADGRRFGLDESFTPADAGERRVLSNWYQTDDGLHALASALVSGGIESFSSTDAVKLAREEGLRLAPSDSGEEGAWVRDATVVDTDDGYLMIYVSEIPE